MTVTHIFRATNRQVRGLSEYSANVGAVSDDPARKEAIPVSLPAQVLPQQEPTPLAPLVLGDRVDIVSQSGSSVSAPAQTPIASAPTGSTKLPAPYYPTDGRIILVAKARGGIGATTLAVNLALEMHLHAIKNRGAVGGRTALVDLDVQLGNAGSFLDLADRGGMLALAQLGPEPDAQAVRHAMVRHPSGLSVLAAPTSAIPFDAFDVGRIACLLDALAAENDVVIVDLPPALIDWLEPLLARAERLLMVTDLAVPSIVRARRIISLMTEDHRKLPVDIVVAHEKKPFRLGQPHRDAETALGHPLRHWLPDETKLARQALDRGEPLVQLAPRCSWSKAVKKMAADLHEAHRIKAMSSDRRDH